MSLFLLSCLKMLIFFKRRSNLPHVSCVLKASLLEKGDRQWQLDHSGRAGALGEKR